jgi:Na+/phosphate symporter
MLGVYTKKMQTIADIKKKAGRETQEMMQQARIYRTCSDKMGVMVEEAIKQLETSTSAYLEELKRYTEVTDAQRNEFKEIMLGFVKGVKEAYKKQEIRDAIRRLDKNFTVHERVLGKAAGDFDFEEVSGIIEEIRRE